MYRLNETPNMESVRLRDPDQFKVGGLHENLQAWEVILRGHPMEEFK